MANIFKLPESCDSKKNEALFALRLLYGEITDVNVIEWLNNEPDIDFTPNSENVQFEQKLSLLL